MPVLDRQEVADFDRAIERVVSAESFDSAVQALRQLFVERLDFAPAAGSVAIHLDGRPLDSRRIAERAAVQVVVVGLPSTGRIAASDVQAALREVRRSLAGEVFLIVTDDAKSQWHFVYPTDKGGREVLRRMVVRPGEHRRTVVEQLAGIYDAIATGGDLRHALEVAYDVEAVTKRFFVQYRAVFGRVMAMIAPSLPNEEECKLFCQMLFNRLMFISDRRQGQCRRRK